MTYSNAHSVSYNRGSICLCCTRYMHIAVRPVRFLCVTGSIHATVSSLGRQTLLMPCWLLGIAFQKLGLSTYTILLSPPKKPAFHVACGFYLVLQSDIFRYIVNYVGRCVSCMMMFPLPFFLVASTAPAPPLLLPEVSRA